MVAEKSFSWGSTTQQSHLPYQHAATLVVAGIVTTQSGMHSPSRFEASLRNSRGKSPRISYGAKSLPPTQFGKLHEPFYTTVSPCVLSKCYASAAYPECRRQNTTAISRTIGVHAPAVIPGYLS